jgi:hypothetical protein
VSDIFQLQVLSVIVWLHNSHQPINMENMILSLTSQHYYIKYDYRTGTNWERKTLHLCAFFSSCICTICILHWCNQTFANPTPPGQARILSVSKSQYYHYHYHHHPHQRHHHHHTYLIIVIVINNNITAIITPIYRLRLKTSPA